MISFFGRYRQGIYIGVVVVFLIGTFVGLGSYVFLSRDVTGAVAAVGSEKIPYSRFLSRLNQYEDAMKDHGADVTDAAMKEVKLNLLREMIVNQILLSKANEAGILVTDEELSRDIRNTPAFQRDGQFDQLAYFNRVRAALHETPQDYEEDQRKQIEAMRLKQLIFNAAKLPPEELRELYAASNKASMKDFDKKKAEFASRVQQQRALELINYYLRQLSTQLEIRSYLDQRESGT
jgi:peptidyl-prolyl cis-trans isomerase D